LAKLHLGAPLILLKALLPGHEGEGARPRDPALVTRGPGGVTRRPIRPPRPASRMARTWALELAPHGHHGHVVAPVRSRDRDVSRGIPAGSEQERALARSIPMGGSASQRMLQRGIVLASPNSSFVTGQTLYVCGGSTSAPFRSDGHRMRIYWQAFSTDPSASYMARLAVYLNDIAAPAPAPRRGISPPNRDFGRLTEFRCAIQAVDNGITAQESGFDAYVMGHFQDPGLYELRSALTIPVIAQAKRRARGLSTRPAFGLVTLNSGFRVWHYDRPSLWLAGRVTHVTAWAAVRGFQRAFAGDEAARARMLHDFAVCAAAGRCRRRRRHFRPACCWRLLSASVASRLDIAGGELRGGRAKSAEMWVQFAPAQRHGASRGPTLRWRPTGPNDFRALVRKAEKPPHDSYKIKTRRMRPEKILYEAEVRRPADRDGKSGEHRRSSVRIALVRNP